MLYALSISVVFGMILSFYLSAIVENQNNLIAQESFLYAQLMAKVTVVEAVISELVLKDEFSRLALG